jgi:hypothetical protein
MTAAELRPLAGPVPTPAGAYDLAALGYIEDEFMLSGEATSYRQLGDRTTDGRWSAKAAGTAPYTTRILVRRPADAAEFSGTVVVEWLNVSGGLDAPPIWMMTHTNLIRRRHAWVGVSAQRAGVEGGGLVDNGMHLKATFPDRYAMLSHPGDAWSFDIFSQAGRAVRGSPAVFGAHAAAARRLIAAGHSQSAAFLVTYINAIDALAPVYDAFAVHGRTGTGASLERGFTPSPPGSAEARAEAIRPDLRVPALVLQTETDVALLGSGHVGQQDADLLRNWEIAGAAHGDTYLLIASGQDDGALPPTRLAELIRPTTHIVIATTKIPVNSGMQHHYVACAALDHLDAWAGGGSAPPTAPRLDLGADGTDFYRDPAGVATGGIRTPWTDVPAAVLSGVGQTGANLFTFLFGVTRPLDPDLLAVLYPGGLADYLPRFEAALDETISAGFVLPADRAEAIAVAEAAVAQADWPGSAG